MVFGNMGSTSGSGVVFTRDPNNGEEKLYGEFLENAQGEDVVAGVLSKKSLLLIISLLLLLLLLLPFNYYYLYIIIADQNLYVLPNSVLLMIFSLGII